MDNWTKKITTYDDIIVVCKKNDYVLHIEATTHLTAPLCRLEMTKDLIDSVNGLDEEGCFISFKPSENGKISYYLVDLPENENETVSKAIATLKAIKSMTEALTYGK